MDEPKEAERPRETTSERFNNWITSIAFVLAGVWGVYTFWHNEIEEPRMAPVNVTTVLELRQGDAAENGLIPVEVTMTANNPGARKVYVLPNYWVAYGLRIDAVDNPNWAASLPETLNARGDVRGARYYGSSGTQLVAGGPAFTDTVLQPDEQISRSFVFYVPRDRFDLLRVRTIIPNSDEEDVLDVRFAFDDRLTTSYFATGGDAEREISAEEAFDTYGMQQSVAERQLPLPRRLRPTE